MPDRGGPPVPPKKGFELKAGPAASMLPSMVQSQPGRPPAAVVRQARAKLPGDDMRVVQQGSAFERLKMGQTRLGRSTDALETQSQPQASAGSEKSKALGKNELMDIHREARVAHAVTLVNAVGAYYKSSAAENQSEIAKLSALGADDLHKITRSYEFAHAHVLTMTDEKHAQKMARESSKEIRDFYEKHGTTDDIVESERIAKEEAQTPLKRFSKR